ncbi:hypothetical protein PILCRDRAFT_828230 [Piloderma croceum F 1598]|uniref:Uncharacterized protein n=1 Tax=Piloderma croceum (strain F 1598) TaxID=765440 RepID=A0A0C3F2T7_PILCF|nr:hypothetical protein PILCRDRAFT_828230 [Piloderma croceum F 1598]
MDVIAKPSIQYQRLVPSVSSKHAGSVGSQLEFKINMQRQAVGWLYIGGIILRAACHPPYIFYSRVIGRGDGCGFGLLKFGVGICAAYFVFC